MTAAAGVWWQAARPRPLPAAAAPVLMGTAMASRDGALHLPSAGAAMAGALLLQVGTNYANDYYDFMKGADTEALSEPLGEPTMVFDIDPPQVDTSWPEEDDD